jgi:hypothetical protein
LVFIWRDQSQVAVENDFLTKIFILDNVDLEYSSFEKIIHLFTCAYIVWSFLPLPPQPSLPGRSCSALITNFVEEKT